jgi:hypothetical protein
MPRTIVATFAAAFLLIGGAALAIACDGGTPAWGNAGGDEYHHECEGGHHSGYNYFGGGKDDCGNCDDSHFSGYSSGGGGGGGDNNCCDNHNQYSGYSSGGGGDNCCDDHKYSGYSSGGGGSGDCNSSSADISPVELSRT